jgi:toxin HigB-1
LNYSHFVVFCSKASLGFGAKTFRAQSLPRSPEAQSIGGWLAISYYPCYHIFMIQSFRDKGTEDVFNGDNTRNARKTCPESLWRVATRKLDQLDSVSALQELNVSPGNRLEALSGDQQGQHSIRINNQYRICFIWTGKGPDQVEIVDYH